MTKPEVKSHLVLSGDRNAGGKRKGSNCGYKRATRGILWERTLLYHDYGWGIQELTRRNSVCTDTHTHTLKTGEI